MLRGDATSWEVRGHVDAPVDAVWGALLVVLPETRALDSSRWAAASRPYVTWTGVKGEGRVRTEVDAARHTVTLEGEWWYRGVYAVESDRRGAQVIYRVTNIAPGFGRWAAQWVQGPQHARQMPMVLGALLDEVGQRLGCTVTPPSP